MIKKITAAGIACTLALAVCGTATAAKLRVATEFSYAPFEYVDTKSGNLVGFDIDLVRLLAKKSGNTVEFIGMNFDSILASVRTGMVDAGVAGITITESRARRVLFSDPYYKGGLSIITSTENASKIRTAFDLRNKVICVQIGTSGADLARKIDGTAVRSFNTAGETFLELGNGGCQAVVGDRPVNDYYMRVAKDAEKFAHSAGTLRSEDYGIIFGRKKADIRAQFNAALKEIKESGEYRDLYVKWFGQAPAE
ncbi:MAG: basic amino acid ABC transporter substrate-binding protein [Duodenibacillus sp.]|nr:basic amino acid ABC transporter substrate-binding protein [Duodenibacillus sp.]